MRDFIYVCIYIPRIYTHMISSYESVYMKTYFRLGSSDITRCGGGEAARAQRLDTLQNYQSNLMRQYARGHFD